MGALARKFLWLAHAGSASIFFYLGGHHKISKPPKLKRKYRNLSTVSEPTNPRSGHWKWWTSFSLWLTPWTSFSLFLCWARNVSSYNLFLFCENSGPIQKKKNRERSERKRIYWAVSHEVVNFFEKLVSAQSFFFLSSSICGCSTRSGWKPVLRTSLWLLRVHPQIKSRFYSCFFEARPSQKKSKR